MVGHGAVTRVGAGSPPLHARACPADRLHARVEPRREPYEAGAAEAESAGFAARHSDARTDQTSSSCTSPR